MPVPVWKVEIGWGSQIAGVLVFGFSDFKTPTTFSVTNKALTSNVATITAPRIRSPTPSSTSSPAPTTT